jgi:hypothetical protein
MRTRDASFKRVLNDAVRTAFLPRATQTKVPRFVQKTFDMGRPLVDLNKAASLADELGDLELIERMRREWP